MDGNHDLGVPDAGRDDWSDPIDANFERLDTAVPIRDTADARDEYDPGDGAKFFATDTGVLSVGDGESWQTIGDLQHPLHATAGDTVANGSRIRVAESGADIQPAIDDLTADESAGPAGGVVLLRRHGYSIDEPIELKKGVQLRGIQPTRYGARDDFSWHYCKLSASESFPRGEPILRTASPAATDVVVGTFKLTGQFKDDRVDPGIHVTADRFTMEWVRGTDLEGDGILVTGAQETDLRNVYLSTRWEDGPGGRSPEGRVVFSKMGRTVVDGGRVWFHGCKFGSGGGQEDLVGATVTENATRARITRGHFTGRFADGATSMVLRGPTDVIDTHCEKVDRGAVLEGPAPKLFRNVDFSRTMDHNLQISGHPGIFQHVTAKAAGHDKWGPLDVERHGIYLDGANAPVAPWINVTVEGSTGYGIAGEIDGTLPIVKFTGATDDPIEDPSSVYVSGQSHGYDVRTEGTAVFSGDGSTRRFTVSDFSLATPVAQARVTPDLSSDASRVAGAYGDSFESDSFEFAFESAPPDGTDNVTVRYRALSEAGVLG